MTLDLDSNELTGPIPEEIFDADRLTIMDLDSNELEGTLSARFANLAELQILFLDNNAFFGTLPAEMGEMERLRFLRLDRNELSGSIKSAHVIRFDETRDGAINVLARLESLAADNTSNAKELLLKLFRKQTNNCHLIQLILPALLVIILLDSKIIDLDHLLVTYQIELNRYMNNKHLSMNPIVTSFLSFLLFIYRLSQHQCILHILQEKAMFLTDPAS